MRITTEEKINILTLCDQKTGRVEIAKKLNMPLHKINRVLQKYKNLKNFNDEKNNKTNQRNELFEKIKIAYLNNKKIKQIANEFKISVVKVTKILNFFNIKPVKSTIQKIENSKLGNKVDHFFDENNLHFAYVMGVILGDGCIYNNPSSEKYYLNITAEDFDISNSCNIYFGEKHIIKKDKNSKAFRLNIWSKPLVDMFKEKYGLSGEKSHNLPWINFEENLCKAFISGLHATDGSIYELTNKYNGKSINWNYTTVCLPFLIKMKETLENFIPTLGKVKIKTRIHKNNNLSYSITYSTQNTLKICNWMYSNTNELIRCNRKYLKYLEWKDYVLGEGKPISKL